ncbi:hypothetical protein JCM5350_003339, partial [Sporobolomyces pararoseus]
MSFCPKTVREQVKLACQASRKVKLATADSSRLSTWIWDDATSWDLEAVKKRVNGWAKSGKFKGTCEQMEFTAHALEYVWLLERAKEKGIPPGFPIFGPLFTPPTVATDRLANRSVANQRLEYFVEPVFVIHPIYFPHHRLDRCPAPGCSGNKVDK